MITASLVSLSLLVALFVFPKPHMLVVINKLSSLRSNTLENRQQGIWNEVSSLSFYEAEMITQNYKYFTRLINKILSTSREFGYSPHKDVEEVKKFLSMDFKFEKKFHDVKKQSYLQFLMASICIWSFILVAQFQLSFHYSAPFILIISFMHLIGFFLFCYIKHHLEKKKFAHYEQLFTSLFMFKSLLSLSYPLQNAIKESQVLRIKLKFVIKRIKTIIHRIQEGRGDISKDLVVLITDSQDQLERDFQTYNRQLKAVQFLIMALFYLTSYFVFMGQLVFQVLSGA